MSQFFSQLHDTTFLSGAGWRVGWQPQRGEFCALVGADTWALELTQSEWQALGRALRAIQMAIAAARETLMEAESVTIEQQTQELTLIATGIPPQLDLYLQLHRRRGAEGFWRSEAVPSLVAAVEQLFEESAATSTDSV
ncbi:DUF1818 family protein [Synechococcus sp. PCC 7336]|uniref:DUF1818 family protein n=1 Tax=Synechococcus sp. PCC 7336 TaxID=195250 RepID=UPI00034D0D53|nr:DUF1818 family protein [Synechococcus sp. PCC 7336]